MKPIPGVRWMAIAGIVSISQDAFAHAPILDCFIEERMVKCQAGFSDGSSAVGRKIQVRDASRKVLLEGVLDKHNTYVFEPPAANYSVVFLGGEGHGVTMHSSDIR